MFQPNVGDEIVIGGYSRFITEHPAAPGSGTPYGQAGRAGTVYQLRDRAGDLAALKVFNPRFRHPSLVEQVGQLRPFGVLPGLIVCHRAVMTPEQQEPLLSRHPDLRYAVLMPWIEGRSWNEIVQDRRPLTRDQSYNLAVALLGVLVHLGQAGVAHGDLSGANLIIDGLDTGDIRVELVDVEQLYAPGLSRPLNVPAGSSGYAHATAGDRLWQADMDRFAGTVLLAEILGWCDERVRAAADSYTTDDGVAYGDTYFAADELQQDCERYRILRDVLAERWGAAGLLERAWVSRTLAECPPFAVGQMGLKALPPPRPPKRDKARADLLAAAALAEQNRQWARAADFYTRLVAGWPGDAATGEWTAALDRARQQERLDTPPAPKPQPARSGRRWAALALVILLLLGGGGAALAALWPPGGGSEPVPTATIAGVVDTTPPPASPTDTPQPPDPTATHADVDADGDADGDGLSDGREVQNYNSDPNNPDSDGDGLSDGQEVQNYNSDPNNPDSDGDGLSDGQEVQNYNSDPNNPDSDGDGLSDSQEAQNYNIDPNNPDSDGDGLSDGQEVQNYNTDPNNPDSDGDGLSDSQEVQNYDTDPNNPDSDGDGLNDREEVINRGTNPNRSDSDSDGLSDEAEITDGNDPLEPEPQEESRVTGFRLVNPTTGRVIGPIEDGDTISLRQSGCAAGRACFLNVEAIVEDSSVESVKFSLDGVPFLKNGRTLENTAPYYMAGDTGSGPYDNWNWAELIGGQHTMEAQPCDRDFGEGECTLPLAVSFTVAR